MSTLILLDRDGVINFDSPAYIKGPAEWHPIPGSLAAIARLKRAGFRVAVCTNQAGIGRGILTREALDAIHDALYGALRREGAELDGLVFCPHHPDDGCMCRKPEPGMLLDMMARFEVPPARTVYVGDSVKDAQAAQRAECRFALVRTGNGATSEARARAAGACCVFDDLAAFATAAVSQSGSWRGC